MWGKTRDIWVLSHLSGGIIGAACSRSPRPPPARGLSGDAPATRQQQWPLDLLRGAAVVLSRLRPSRPEVKGPMARPHGVVYDYLCSASPCRCHPVTPVSPGDALATRLPQHPCRRRPIMMDTTRRVTYRGNPAFATMLVQMLADEGATVQWDRPPERRGMGDMAQEVIVQLAATGSVTAIATAVAKFRKHMQGRVVEVTIEDHEQDDDANGSTKV